MMSIVRMIKIRTTMMMMMALKIMMLALMTTMVIDDDEHDTADCRYRIGEASAAGDGAQTNDMMVMMTVMMIFL